MIDKRNEGEREGETFSTLPGNMLYDCELIMVISLCHMAEVFPCFFPGLHALLLSPNLLPARNIRISRPLGMGFKIKIVHIFYTCILFNNFQRWNL